MAPGAPEGVRPLTVIVATLTPADADDYRRLRLTGLEECPAAFCSSPEDELALSAETAAARLEAAADGSACVFGVRRDGRLVGAITFEREWRAKLAHWATLTGMYVESAARRLGVGGALLDAAIGHAGGLAGLQYLRLSVMVGNRPARSLYRSRGFVVVGVEPEVLRVGDTFHDEELMALRLPVPRGG